jgi:hypothetical protein
MAEIHRKVGGKLFEKQLNASEPQMVGAPVVIYSTPYRYQDRNVTPELIADSYKIPIIFSSLSFLNRLCFGGLSFKLESIDGPEDDTKKTQIDQALKQIKTIDKSLARIGINKNCSTLDCVRAGALSTWSYRQAFFEKIVTTQEGNLYAPRLQYLQGQSFSKTPTTLASQTTRYKADELLHGVVFDIQDAEAHFFQNTDSIKEPVEVPADQILYIEDKGVPPNTSMLHSIMSTVEFAKQARHDFRLAMQRVGIPKEVAEVDGSVIAQMKTAGVEITGGYQTLVDYLNNMVVGQSNSQAEVALPGTRFKYPVIPIALNPMEVEKFIETLFYNHFFGKGITEQLAQAISTSGAPGKLLLDTIISGHQEVAGKPFEEMWQRDFIDINGYDLVISFDYWSWSPKDQKAEADKATTMFSVGGSLVNDYRSKMGEKAYDKVQLKQLFEEQNALKRGKLPGEPVVQPPTTGAQGLPLTPEEQAAQARKKKEADLLAAAQQAA